LGTNCLEQSVVDSRASRLIIKRLHVTSPAWPHSYLTKIHLSLLNLWQNHTGTF